MTAFRRCFSPTCKRGTLPAPVDPNGFPEATGRACLAMAGAGLDRGPELKLLTLTGAFGAAKTEAELAARFEANEVDGCRGFDALDDVL